jgi:putative ABC transport system permease protein
MLKNELGREPAIDRITVCSDAIQDIKMSMGGIADWTGKKPDAQPNITPLSVDVDFRKIFNLQMEEGRWFRSDNEEGKHGYILNQSAIAELGIEKPYIGQYFSILGDTGHIIGVVKDFHFRDYHQKISASVLLNNPDMRGTFFIQANGSKMKQAIAKTETVWKQFFPKTPFEYKFMDEEFAQMYRSESKTSQLLGLFSGIAIFISCLGLLGLVLFITEQRSREISIRKILGAGVTNIFSLVTREFVILVMIAFLIASPIAWMVMNRWLLDFAYRTDFSWWIFAIAGFGVLGIALLTMSIQAIKASVANPASSLRNE